MPLVQIKGINGVINQNQKKEIIEKVTDAIVSVKGETARPLTWVIIEDVNSGDWGVGGKPVTAEDIKKKCKAA
ncbi:MAG: 4-oxalocrotonate tautomerase family protein [Nitrospinae bacterium]|nr:4-oxalocrotonate tautomerase family protein [Nitrospinota bacterium]